MPKYTPKTCTVPHINSEQYMLYLVVQTYSIQINADNTDQYRVIPVTYQSLQNIPTVLSMPIFAHLKYQYILHIQYR